MYERQRNANAPLRTLKHFLDEDFLVHLRAYPPTSIPSSITLEKLAFLGAKEFCRKKISRRDGFLEWPKVRRCAAYRPLELLLFRANCLYQPELGDGVEAVWDALNLQCKILSERVQKR